MILYSCSLQCKLQRRTTTVLKKAALALTGLVSTQCQTFQKEPAFKTDKSAIYLSSIDIFLAFAPEQLLRLCLKEKGEFNANGRPKLFQHSSAFQNPDSHMLLLPKIRCIKCLSAHFCISQFKWLVMPMNHLVMWTLQCLPQIHMTHAEDQILVFRQTFRKCGQLTCKLYVLLIH